MAKKSQVKRSPVTSRQAPAKEGALQKGKDGTGARRRKPPLSARMSKSEAQALRFAAGTHFVMDLKHRTVREMLQLDEFKGVKIETMTRWADEDGWYERRRQNSEQWKQLLEKKLGESLVQQKSAQLKELTDMYHKTRDVLDNSPLLMPKSYEGMVGATLKVADMMDRWRTDIAKMLPGTATQEVGDTMKHGVPVACLPELSPEEARDAAHSIMQRRREETEKRLALTQQAKADSAVRARNPQPEVVVDGKTLERGP